MIVITDYGEVHPVAGILGRQGEIIADLRLQVRVTGNNEHIHTAHIPFGPHLFQRRGTETARIGSTKCQRLELIHQ